MKTLLLALALALSLVTVPAAEFTNARPVFLEWNYPAEDLTPTLVFYVHTNGSLAVPVESWPVATVVTNAAAFNSVPALLTPPRCYFVICASNEWGRSDFSDVLASVPPRRDVKLRLR